MIGSAFEIANVLGAGFLEKVYERALIRELALRGVRAEAQVSFPVCYKGQYVGEYMADLVVEEACPPGLVALVPATTRMFV